MHEYVTSRAVTGHAWVSACLFSLSLTGCATEITSASTGSTGPIMSAPPSWPKRVTLVTKPSASLHGGVWLVDGAVTTGDGDLNLDQAQVLSIASPTPGSLCELGTFAMLGDIPATADKCAGSLSGGWKQRAYLSATTLHTSDQSDVIGNGLLVRDAAHTALYRLRVVGDSYDAEGLSTATFDYEPVP